MSGEKATHSRRCHDIVRVTENDLTDRRIAMQAQDSSHPTGVRGSGHVTEHSMSRARNRKANAAIELRLSGATWSQIAEALGYPTARQALVATEKALEKALKDNDRESMRRLAGARLDRLLLSVWSKAIDPAHPDHLLAVSKAREIVDRHAKLFGLDAPTEVVVHTPTQTELEAWVARVVALRIPQVEEDDILDGEVLDEEEPVAISP